MSESGAPVAASSTTTPTGLVSTSASRSALAPLVAVRAGVGEHCLGLLGEQRQHRLVGVGEPAFLAAEEEAAHGRVPIAHRGRLERPAGHREGRAAERAPPGVEVRQAQRRGEPTQVAEQAQPVRPVLHCPAPLLRKPRGDEVAGRARLVHRRDDAVLGAGERAGARHHLAQHRVQVEARADAQHRLHQHGLARGGIPRRAAVAVRRGFRSALRPAVLARGVRLPRCFVALAHGPVLPVSATRPLGAASVHDKCTIDKSVDMFKIYYLGGCAR